MRSDSTPGGVLAKVSNKCRLTYSTAPIQVIRGLGSIRVCLYQSLQARGSEAMLPSAPMYKQYPCLHSLRKKSEFIKCSKLRL